jgi:hypothetical protein
MVVEFSPQDVEKLMLKREYFPIRMYEAQHHSDKTKRWWTIDSIEIPPYHPSMRDTGIPFELVPSLLEGALEETLKDMREMAKKTGYEHLLDEVEFSKDGKIRSYHKVNMLEDGTGVIIDHVPIVDHFSVGRDDINPYYPGGDQGIIIQNDRVVETFYIPQTVTFSPELMKEYEMEERPWIGDHRRISCPNGWYRHNLAKQNAIFYRNLVIEIDNAIVGEKYGQ